ncbi:MAG: hypothetical protein H6926_05545 [Chromatiales bacterium]|nr:hypothetical protein [Gammaproteobacteria bacterium]MCP5352632.1 hypothetical protein [Chromatiales bacterium]
MDGTEPITQGLRRRRLVANVTIIVATVVFGKIAKTWNSDVLFMVGLVIVWGPMAIYYGLYISRLTCPRCGENFGCNWERHSTPGMRLLSPLCVPSKCPECGYREK